MDSQRELAQTIIQQEPEFNNKLLWSRMEHNAVLLNVLADRLFGLDHCLIVSLDQNNE